MSRTKNSDPVIALLTDFGTSDEYAGVMKGVILSIAPSARIVDISHNVEPQNVEEAGYLLWASYQHFPEGSVFVAVVDPGVGTERGILGLRTRRHTFLAPDNGLLDFILSEEHASSVVLLRDAGAYVASNISKTFHGRDIFAPGAAWLAKGVPLSRLGVRRAIPKVASPFVSSDAPAARGRILHVDKYGNIVTNFRWKKSERERGVVLRDRRLRRWIENYEEGPRGVPCLIIGGTGLVEIVVKRESAAALLGVKAGETLGVLRRNH